MCLDMDLHTCKHTHAPGQSVTLASPFKDSVNTTVGLSPWYPPEGTGFLLTFVSYYGTERRLRQQDEAVTGSKETSPGTPGFRVNPSSAT